MSKMKKVFIAVAIIIILFLSVIVFLAIKEIGEEKVLKQEIINFSNKNLSKDDFTVKIKTTGDCAYIESAVKRYYKELSDNVKAIGYISTSEELINIFTAPNLMSDRPNYEVSHNIIKNTKKKVNENFENINQLCDKKTVKKLVDKEKFTDQEYYYDLYLQLVYTKRDLSNLEDINEWAKFQKSKLNKYLDKMDEILVFLQNNDKLVHFKNNNIYFDTEECKNEYNNFYIELNNISSESQDEDIDISDEA